MSDLMLDVGTASDLKMAFRRAGYDPADITKLCTGDMAAKILPILRGMGIVQILKHIVDLAGDCMPKDWKSNGWKIEKHVVNGTLELDPSQLKLHFLPNQKDSKVIEGNKLLKELEKNKVPVLNACVLDYLLLHPELIPAPSRADSGRLEGQQERQHAVHLLLGHCLSQCGRRPVRSVLVLEQRRVLLGLQLSRQRLGFSEPRGDSRKCPLALGLSSLVRSALSPLVLPGEAWSGSSGCTYCTKHLLKVNKCLVLFHL